MASDITIIEPIYESDERGIWTPVLGQEGNDFLEEIVREGSRESIRDTALAILAKGVPPNKEEGRETGLVVGYVQSGKTLSFEAVTSLAWDNDFQVVIVVAGTSNPLLEQSTGRLERDLRLNAEGRKRHWILFKNPSNDDATLHAIRDVIEERRDPGILRDFKKTVLITVLKHHQRLGTLTQLLKRLDMKGVPVLIIDDEADQASLNTEVAQGEESTTYRRLMELRETLSTHTYLQYTATPQAPLLVNIIDSLSPNFVQVLDPGETYAGGREFFEDNYNLVKVIPPHEVPTNSNPLNEPPETLLEALRVFMVGVTVCLREGQNTGNRSMLVHPSYRTTQHQEFYNWVRDIFEDWKRVFSLQDGDPDKQELLEEFRTAYNDLSETVDELPPFEELSPSFLFAFRNTRILEVNAREGRTPEVQWRSAYGWILVGGQAMGRGFTVEGLTVTYMPRGIGTGNVDTIQQRARFFGYKKPYLGFCRVYLEQGTLDAYQSYVVHEEDIRRQLKNMQDLEKPLNEWKRAFVLDTALRPCREQVIEFDYIRGLFSDNWARPRVVLASEVVIQANRKIAASFVQTLRFVDDDGHRERTETQKHHICKDIPLRDVLEKLLIPFRITGTTDSQRYTGLLLQLSRALEAQSDEVCTVYRMSPAVRRTRGIDSNGELTNLFQGASPVEPIERRGEIYPGDREICDNPNVTVQIHTLDLVQNEGIVKEDVSVIAVWVPARLGTSWIVQEQQSSQN